MITHQNNSRPYGKPQKRTTKKPKNTQPLHKTPKKKNKNNTNKPKNRKN